MDSGVIFALALVVLFFGSISWLVIHVRRQDKKSKQEENQPAPEEKTAPLIRKAG
jgi:hypothetical protein